MELTPLTLFRALADETRLQCLLLLADQGELCVCELTHALGVAQPKISRHLASLREAGVVDDRRAGQWIHYRLHPNLPEWARAVLREAHGKVRRSTAFLSQCRAIKATPNRPATRCCG